MAKIIIVKIIVVIATAIEIKNNDEDIKMEVKKNDKGMRKKMRIADIANLKNIFLSQANIFRKIKKYSVKIIIADINIIKKPKGNSLS